MIKIVDTISVSCNYYIHLLILNINKPTKTRDLQVLLYNNSNSMFLSFFSAILIGPLVKLNFYTSIKTRAMNI